MQQTPLVNNLIHWLNHMDVIYDKFVASGFSAPKIVLDHIEAMRPRSTNEKDYRFYCRERVKERALLMLKYDLRWWGRKNRHALSDAERSGYLDSLEHRYDSGKFSNVISEIGERNYNPDALLDINYFMYCKWITNWRVLNKSYEEYRVYLRHQLVFEADTILPSVDFLQGFSFDTKITGAVLLKLMQAMADEYGFTCFHLERGSKPRCILETRIAEGLSLYLEWEDYYLLKSQGEIDFRIIIGEPGVQLWPRDSRPFFWGDIESFLPAAPYNVGMRHNPSLKLLSLIAHGNFMRAARVS